MDRRTYLCGVAPLLAGLVGCLGSSSSPSVVSTAVTDQSGPESPFAVSAKTVESNVRDQEPAQIRLTVTNTSDSRATYETGPPEPFGIVGPGGPGAEFILWTDTYRTNSCIDTDGHRLDGACDIGPSEITLKPGEERSRMYEIDEPPGTYTTFLQVDGVRYELELTIERSQ